METRLPYFTEGEVIRGFGRGSKELGIPTANFPDDVVNQLPDEITTGIFFGWAKLEDEPVRGMVVSIGWNPFYNNTKRTIETHILHEYDEDFYGSRLKIAIAGFIRPEKNFSSVDDLVAEIRHDIRVAGEKLRLSEHEALKAANFFAANKT